MSLNWSKTFIWQKLEFFLHSCAFFSVCLNLIIVSVCILIYVQKLNKIDQQKSRRKIPLILWVLNLKTFWCLGPYFLSKKSLPVWRKSCRQLGNIRLFWDINDWELTHFNTVLYDDAQNGHKSIQILYIKREAFSSVLLLSCFSRRKKIIFLRSSIKLVRKVVYFSM